jgi:hypothetical protein
MNKINIHAFLCSFDASQLRHRCSYPVAREVQLYGVPT